MGEKVRGSYIQTKTAHSEYQRNWHMYTILIEKEQRQQAQTKTIRSLCLTSSGDSGLRGNVRSFNTANTSTRLIQFTHIHPFGPDNYFYETTPSVVVRTMEDASCMVIWFWFWEIGRAHV